MMPYTWNNAIIGCSEHIPNEVLGDLAVILDYMVSSKIHKNSSAFQRYFIEFQGLWKAGANKMSAKFQTQTANNVCSNIYRKLVFFMAFHQQKWDNFQQCTILWVIDTGLALDILKVESWTQMGRTANIIIKCSIHVFASICKNMRILLMGRRYRERCRHVCVAGFSWFYILFKN